MLGLCKCCLGYSSLKEKKLGEKDPGKTDSPEIFDLKAPLVPTEPVIVVDEPTKQNSSFAEEDSGACCQVSILCNLRFGRKSFRANIYPENYGKKSCKNYKKELGSRCGEKINKNQKIPGSLPAQITFKNHK
jgi:hypothetical protein